MRGIILCTLLLLTPAVGAAPDACDEKTIPWAIRSACLFAPVVEDDRIIVGHALVCAGGVSTIEVDLGPTSVLVCYCTLPPGSPVRVPSTSVGVDGLVG